MCHIRLPFRKSAGPLALWIPLLERLQVAEIIEHHLPTDPQADCQNGDVLSLLLAARLSNPVALVNVPAWAKRSGADALWDIPADKLNDDRLDRALDKFYTKRHHILSHVAAQAAEQFDLSLDRLHYDPTHLLFYGDYESSQPRSTNRRNDPPAHITTGHSVRDHKIVHAGVCAAIDDKGAVPVFGRVTDGNHNGHTAIAEQLDLLQQHLRPERLTLFSDRGTCSNGHLVRLYRHGFHAVCAAPWKEFQPLYEANRSRLLFQRASYLSIEQQRRRSTGSALPLEHYEIAVLKQPLTDPETGEAPARGCRRPTHRLVFFFDQAAADTDADYDGLSVLVTTVPLHTANADSPFTQYKEQVLLEHAHHQLKTPLAVRPMFLKSPRRVEALACLMLLASTIYHLSQRAYRQQLPADAPLKDHRTTTETLLRAFAGYSLKVQRTCVGRVISPTQLSTKQRDILNRLRFPTPNQILRSKLPVPPT